MSSPYALPLISVVVIGRNEGERLRRCLDSVRAADWWDLPYELIYVDSRSDDGSAALARRAGAKVLQAEGPARNAAAGRNTGWRAARAGKVLFLDGDTVLDPDFPRQAAAALENGAYACVWGHRRELAPRQSLYTEVLDLDWIYRAGETDYCGGDALFRKAALAQAQGFDATLNAGEEPDLCRRLRADGWRILHIDQPMTLHDLAIRRLGQYWQRAVRAGQAYADVSRRYAGTADPLWRNEARRNLIHGGAVAVAPAALLACAYAAPAMAAGMMALGGLLWLRSARRALWKAGNWRLALLYALHSHAQQVPVLYGQLQSRWARRKGAATAFIDYKRAPADALRRQP